MVAVEQILRHEAYISYHLVEFDWLENYENCLGRFHYASICYGRVTVLSLKVCETGLSTVCHFYPDREQYIFRNPDKNTFQRGAQTSFTNFYGPNSYPLYCYWNCYFDFRIHVGNGNLKIIFMKSFIWRPIPRCAFYYCGEGNIVRKNKKYSENHQNAYQSEVYIITI